jgi:hypothetical protein
MNGVGAAENNMQPGGTGQELLVEALATRFSPAARF